MSTPRVPPPGEFGAAAEFGGVGDRHYLTELFRDSLDPGYAGAARRRTGGDQSPRARRGSQAAMLLTLVVVGLVMAVAYQQVVAEEPTRTRVRADLEEQIRERGDTTEALRQTAERLRDEVAGLRDQELADPQVRALRELEAATGLSQVHGDGVVVRIADGPPTVDPVSGAQVTDPEARILDLDLQRITNGLWAAGAEAIAINDRRLTATSTIRSASGAILIDRVPVAGPYEVAAIGPEELAEVFAGSVTGAQMQQLVSEYGIGYEVGAAEDLTLPAASAPQLHYATPAGGGS